MSDIMKSSPGLLSMPNEILAEICVHAHDGDQTTSRGKKWLRAVRLACKQLHVPATIEFGKRFLTTIPVMAARGSLETLVEICKHPLIGPHVSEIQLYGYRATQYEFFNLQEDLKAYIEDHDLHGARCVRRRLQLYLDYLEEELELEQCVGIFQRLQGALEMVRDHGHPVTLAVFNDANVQPLGHMTAIKQLSENSKATLATTCDNPRVRSTLNVLLAAAGLSGCPVDRLEVLTSHMWDDEDDTVLTIDTASREDVLSMVKVCHVEISREILVHNYHDMLNTDLQRARNLVELFLGVENLDTIAIPSGDVDICAQTIQSIQSRCLRKIELVEMVCRQRDIISLLERNRDTLEDLRLSKVALLGSWQAIMTWVRDHCSLKFLSVEKLFEFQENATGDLPFVDGELWVDRSLGMWDESGDLSHLDRYLEQKREEQAELEEED
jgi:hypothetical protein